MYIRITDLCNMECAHCSYSCGPYKNHTHMDEDTFLRAVEIAKETTRDVMLGGGEPTVHPEFWNLFGHAMLHAEEDYCYVWLATNGKRPTDAMMLAALAAWPHEFDGFWEIASTLYPCPDNADPDCYSPIDTLMSEKGLTRVSTEQWRAFSCALSVDQWHDPIPGAVEAAFKTANLELRNVGYNISSSGRGIDIVGEQEDFAYTCPCPAPRVEPDGTIRTCGCDNSPVMGHIMDPDAEERIRWLVDNQVTCYKELDLEMQNAQDVSSAPLEEWAPLHPVSRY